MLQTFDPFAIQLWNGFGIRWYGLAYLAGFIAAYYMISYLSRSGRSPLKPELVSDFVFTSALGVIIGGRLGYCIFYSPELFLRFTGNFPFWGVLAVNEGGMSSHGGIIGILIASAWYAKRHNFEKLHAVDLCSLTGPIGIFFGRLANFINGELVGRPCPPDYPLAVKFPQDIFSWPARDPQRLADLSSVVDSFGINAETWKTWVSTLSSNRQSWSSVENTLGRIVDAVQSGNLTIMSKITPLLTPRYPSQLYEAGLEGLFLFLALAFIWRKPRKPGVIMSAFGCIYSLVRIIGEQYRMPDAHIGYEALGLTRGQWLSVGLFVVGMVCLIWCSSRNKAKI